MTRFYQLPPWALMWLLALGLYGAAKGATLAVGRCRGVPASRRLAYLLLFPGMNAEGFCAERLGVRRPWTPGMRFAGNAALGAVLLWGLARLVPPQHPLVQGWIGMIGMILLLHFGLLQFAALAWQAAGFDAPLLMNEPIRSASVGEFWGLRWNTAFRQLAHQFLFRPLARRVGARAAALLTFAISGLVHDLVISVPAGGGFGLPTAYFLLQAMGMQFERSELGRRWLCRRPAGRCFAMAMVALPAPLLFHPLFVTRVILPFMSALGALPREVCP